MKSGRISRLVNDHLHNGQKRRDGSSLVVETGFPTSLVDLFMKNRGKLKKRRHSPRVSDGTDSIIAGSPASLPSPPAPLPSPIEEYISPPVCSSLDCPSPSRSPPRLALPNSWVPDDNCVVSVDAKTAASFVFVKLFLVLLIAVGTKGLTVGITISAFLLLFLEYVGKRACGFLNPFADATGVLKLMLQRVRFIFRFKKVKLDEYDGSLLWQEPSLNSFGSGCRNQEIQIVEANYYSVSHVEEIHPENEDLVGSSLEGSFRYQELVPDEAAMEEQSKPDVVELKAANLRRVKMKLKLKKIFRKKQPSSRQEDEPQRLENVQEIVFCDEQEAKQCHDEGELVITHDSSSKVNEVVRTKSREKQETFESGLSWRYMVLCLIILVGLVRGRGIAILLTLSWYMLLKLLGRLPRCMKVPTI